MGSLEPFWVVVVGSPLFFMSYVPKNNTFITIVK
jgi:hypothetical protein